MATIRRVSEAEPEHLQYFSKLGLVPHARIRVVDCEPFGGPLRLRNADGAEHVIGETLAHEIWVELDRAPKDAKRTAAHRARREEHLMRVNTHGQICCVSA
jgi:Fe2+ transport system protein FeoA